LDHLDKEEGNRLLVEVSEFLKFNDIYATLTRFTLRDKRLRALEFPSHLDLGQAGFLPGLSEPFKELAIAGSIGSVLQDNWNY